ncbi:PREDICTED: putative histone-lysine N-methyltransferase 1 [Eufriesea mexicana]|uniref:putative histone-lysine N-methyltransferase 1 n=1 Tax=Eufriesea mexicana TaxID=516756 RepID=UPI00083BCC13|nr:PREDICTED: putative histone-lysine N-methyltransferase 1 [Eufriesea mexicana]
MKDKLSSEVSNMISNVKHTNIKRNLNRSENNDINKVIKQDISERRFLNLKKHSNNMNIVSNNINSQCHILKPYLTQSENKNYSKNIYKDKSLSFSNIYENKNTFTPIPVGCSTMINDSELDMEKEMHFKNIENQPFNISESSKSFQGEIILSNKSSLKQNIIENIITEYSLMQEVSKNNYEPDSLTQISQQVDINYTPQTLQNNSKVKSVNKSTCLAEVENVNTNQTSLNVNTSVDQISINNKHRNKYKQKSCKEKKYRNSENKEKHIHAGSLKITQESINTVCTSLQMNTSLNTSTRLQYNGNKIDVLKTHNSKDNNIVNSPIALNNSSCNMSHINSQKSLIIKERTHTNETDIDQNMNSVSLSEKKGCKRKLFPLRESSQLLSFSPMQNEKYLSHPNSICKKRHKKRTIRINKPVNINDTECTDQNENKNYDERKQKRTKNIVVKKIVNKDILRKLGKNTKDMNNLEATNIYISGRNSLDDFQPLQRPSVVQFKKKKQIHKLNIVTTGLSNEDKDMVKNIVRALDSAKIESSVTKNTTHVVTTGVRTINLLHGIIRGCWVVSLEWVFKSLENNAWLNPEKYEMVHFSEAILENRKNRQLFGKSYIPELFTACGYIYVEKSTMPPCNVLKDLIKAAGGFITENPETARVLIGVNGLKETWVLDSITSGELQPHNQYQRTKILTHVS